MRHNKQGGSERVKRISRGVAALELFRISNRDPLQPRQRALLKSPAQLYYYSPPPLPPPPRPAHDSPPRPFRQDVQDCVRGRGNYAPSLDVSPSPDPLRARFE